MAKPRFIVFEGIEGSGKSYQSNEMYNALKKEGERVFLTTQPWMDDRIGKLIREELADKKDAISVLTLQYLFMANRADHVEKLIEPRLKMGDIVVCDRYWMSTAAYGSAFSKGKNADIGYFAEVNSIFPKPDVVFYIDVSPEVAHERILKNRPQDQHERFDRLDKLKLLRSKYQELEKRYDGIWISINGSKDKEMVTEEIMRQYYKM